MKLGELNKGVIQLSKLFKKHGQKLYLVGGSVRNMILGLPQGDLDVCSEVLPKEATAFLKQEGCTIVEKALSLGTIEIHLRLDGKKYVFEHTTLRQDYYNQGGQHRPYKVNFTKDISKDAKRRDFTVNALYLDIESGCVFDPTQKGVQDIKNGVLRAAADKAIDTLKDDGLRIMRMVRLYSELGFVISEDLLECARQNTELLEDISAERKRQELERIIMADTKYGKNKAHLKGLLLLNDIGALKYVLPSLEKTRGIEQNKQYHSHDVLDHCIHSCGEAYPIFKLRLAALLHDVGKPDSIQTVGNMYNHAQYGKDIARTELNALKFDNKTKKTVLTLIENHMFDLEAKAKPKTIRKHAIKLGRENFELLIMLRIADVAGSGKGQYTCASAQNWQKELDIMVKSGVPWSICDIEVSGKELMEAIDIPQSKALGELLEELFKYCVLYPTANKKEQLIKRAKKITQK